MKRQLFLCFCISQFLFSCLAEQNNELLVGSCMDNIKNQNEEGVDCGGICDNNCVIIPPVIVPCEDILQKNVITLNGFEIELTDQNHSASQTSDYFEIYIRRNLYEEINIRIHGSTLPKEPTEYELNAWYDLEKGEASIRYLNFYSFIALKGNLYVRYVDGEWKIEICPTTLVGEGFEWDFQGRIDYRP